MTSFRLDVERNGLHAVLAGADGAHLLSPALISSFDTVDGKDETTDVAVRRPSPGLIEVERSSTIWERSGLSIVLQPDRLELMSWVEGAGVLAEVHLLGGRSLSPAAATGPILTGTSLTRLYSPNPGDPGVLLRSAARSAVIGVNGDGALGRGHWFFTPAPLLLALAGAGDEWLSLAVTAPVDELDFVEVEYRPADRAFELVLDYQGHRTVDGRFEAPLLVLEPGLASPADALRRHRLDASARGHVPPVAERARPAWWEEPIFCGWGAQCARARAEAVPAPTLSTQANYEAFLSALEDHSVVPGTIVIDDKWQLTYGENVPDPEKWPDLRGFVAGRHARGQHVLLWWKAWDPEGLDDALTIRNAAGAPVAIDPNVPEAVAHLRRTVRELLSPDGVDADGLKIDFTGRTPSGRGYERRAPGGWGIHLLHDLLSVVYDEAKRCKPDALIVTHAPHAAFVDVTDMIRLNDALRLDDPGPRPDVVPQMRYRAEVVHATAPELLVETDDWCLPDRATWRRFLDEKPLLGVPSLYYATEIDLSGEALEEDDYAELRRVFREWREGRVA